MKWTINEEGAGTQNWHNSKEEKNRSLPFFIRSQPPNCVFPDDDKNIPGKWRKIYCKKGAKPLKFDRANKRSFILTPSQLKREQATKGAFCQLSDFWRRRCEQQGPFVQLQKPTLDSLLKEGSPSHSLKTPFARESWFPFLFCPQYFHLFFMHPVFGLPQIISR